MTGKELTVGELKEMLNMFPEDKPVKIMGYYSIRETDDPELIKIQRCKSMTTKLIERYVIRDAKNVIINCVEDMTDPHNFELSVFDRKNMETIATINNRDKDENMAMAQAVIDTINNYGEHNDSD